MPRYIYDCISCSGVFEIIHPYKELKTDCITCGKTDTLKKNLSAPINRNDISKRKYIQKVGAVVVDAIEKANKELADSKKDFIKREK
mgnify:CR=1 FL=1